MELRASKNNYDDRQNFNVDETGLYLEENAAKNFRS
jgi:hypothetical protein